MKEALGKHQHDFVVAPIDKAANILSFMCKIFYTSTLLKIINNGVLGIPNKRIKLISDYNKIILFNSAINEIKQHFLMPIGENITVLPTPYRILKMQKPPVGTRFIIASKQCVIKPFIKNITAAFKLLYKSVQKYHN